MSVEANPLPPSRAIEHPAPPRLLVSVRDPDEAALARNAGADLVDAKDPAMGALGALPVPVVRSIVRRVAGSVTTSAVAGEPSTGETLIASVAAMAATGVDFVKVAVTPAHGASALAMGAATAPGRLIGVLFADDEDRPGIVAMLAEAGFCGAMIDTRGKDGRPLADHLNAERLSAFVSACRGHGLLSGLAGSLRIDHIAPLARLAPDFLGFRGGLCRGGDRRNPLDLDRVRTAARALRAGHRCNAA